MPGLRFAEFSGKFGVQGMSVMDGKRCVATAHPKTGGRWLLRLRAGSWLDPRARFPRGPKAGSPKGFPHLLVVDDRREARTIMMGLTLPQPREETA